MTPIKDNVLIQLDNRSTVSNGGIHIPKISQRAEEWGTVISVGKDCVDLSEGDRVLVLRTQGTHYIQNQVDMIILREKKVLARDLA